MKVGGSGSDSTPAPGQPAGGLDWFDIDSFLDDCKWTLRMLQIAWLIGRPSHIT